jgi:hypothetical protein
MDGDDSSGVAGSHQIHGMPRSWDDAVACLNLPRQHTRKQRPSRPTDARHATQLGRRGGVLADRGDAGRGARRGAGQPHHVQAQHMRLARAGAAHVPPPPPPAPRPGHPGRPGRGGHPHPVALPGSVAGAGYQTAGMLAAPDRGVSVPDRGVSVPDRGVSVPDRGVSVPDRGVSVPQTARMLAAVIPDGLDARRARLAEGCLLGRGARTVLSQSGH